MILDCASHPGSPCQTKSLGTFRDESGKVGEIEVHQCLDCGHAITLPPLTDVAFLYDGRQSQDFQPDAHGASHWIKDIAFLQQARKLLSSLGFQPQSALDFGCGSGQFTQVLARLLAPGAVVGSDFDKSPPGNLIDGQYVPSSELGPLTGTFDLVLAMHVLEHDDDTHALLSRIVKMARRGGTVVIEVPHVDCIWARFFGRHWDAWYVPFHRTHFSRSSFVRRIEQGGLTVVALHDACVPTMGRTLAGLFGGKNNLFWLLAGIALHPLQWFGELVTGRPSALRVIARRQ